MSKKAAKSAVKAAKRPYNKSGKYSKSTKGTRKAKNTITLYKNDGGSPFVLSEGVPSVRGRVSELDQARIRKNLKDMLPNKNHVTMPLKYKQPFLRMAGVEFPEYKLRSFTNKEKEIVSIWREA